MGQARHRHGGQPGGCPVQHTGGLRHLRRQAQPGVPPVPAHPAQVRQRALRPRSAAYCTLPSTVHSCNPLAASVAPRQQPAFKHQGYQRVAHMVQSPTGACFQPQVRGGVWPGCIEQVARIQRGAGPPGYPCQPPRRESALRRTWPPAGCRWALSRSTAAACSAPSLRPTPQPLPPPAHHASNECGLVQVPLHPASMKHAAGRSHPPGGSSNRTGLQPGARFSIAPGCRVLHWSAASLTGQAATTTSGTSTTTELPEWLPRKTRPALPQPHALLNSGTHCDNCLVASGSPPGAFEQQRALPTAGSP